ncbi:hypothetical protein B0H11DRAFT_2299035 [Mycena galericulata]|nr:hypothetical protein B0H11DRAFT_2299035 [Mycena galericulata]
MSAMCRAIAVMRSARGTHIGIMCRLGRRAQGTEPDTASTQGRGKNAKQLSGSSHRKSSRIKNSVGAVPAIATGAPEKEGKIAGMGVGGFGRK